MMRRIWLHAWLPAADSPSEAEFIWTVRNVGIDRVPGGCSASSVAPSPRINRATPRRMAVRRTMA
jgi:hypothetical protein